MKAQSARKGRQGRADGARSIGRDVGTQDAINAQSAFAVPAEAQLAASPLRGHGGEPGTVYWITGLAAAGKTTVATLLCERLRRIGRPAVLLDGDRLRLVLDAEAAFASEERRRLAMIYGRLCRELADQGIDVVCATISMFHAVRDWNRQNIDRYREIYLRVPAEVLRRRDPKGIYARHARGAQAQVVGQDLEAELPLAPDLVIDNDGAMTPDQAVDLIVKAACGPARAVA